MADHWFQSTGRFGLLKVIAPSFFDGFSRERWQNLIEHLKSNVMEKVSDNLLLFSHNLQANGAQFFWDTLYIFGNFDRSGPAKMSNFVQSTFSEISTGPDLQK